MGKKIRNSGYLEMAQNGPKWLKMAQNFIQMVISSKQYLEIHSCFSKNPSYIENSNKHCLNPFFKNRGTQNGPHLVKICPKNDKKAAD